MCRVYSHDLFFGFRDLFGDASVNFVHRPNGCFHLQTEIINRPHICVLFIVVSDDDRVYFCFGCATIKKSNEMSVKAKQKLFVKHIQDVPNKRKIAETM